MDTPKNFFSCRFIELVEIMIKGDNMEWCLDLEGGGHHIFAPDLSRCQ
jgi:hypothetical protein